LFDVDVDDADADDHEALNHFFLCTSVLITTKREQKKLKESAVYFEISLFLFIEEIPR
jgi:hypothetical protein